MAKKKVKTNFGEIEKLHKDEIVNKTIIENIQFLTPPEEYNGAKIDYVADEAGRWPTKEEMNVLNKTSDRLFFRSPKQEAEWITQIRNYCRENKILPTHLIEIHKEWTIREQKYNQTFKTEKAPE